MQLVADRFAIDDEERVVDLATGARITLKIGSAGGPSDQLRWTMRCDTLHAVRHRAVASLVDFGTMGESSRFEAWLCGARWSGAMDDARSVHRSATRFLSAAGVTTGSASPESVHDHLGRAVVLPDEGTGYPQTTAAADPADFPVDERGTRIQPAAIVAALGEMFDAPPAGRPHVAAIWGPEGSGKTTLVSMLARLARARGFVPVAARLIEGAYAELWQGRSVFIIADGEGPIAWNALLHSALRSPQPHVFLIAGRDEYRGVGGVALSRMTADALAACVWPQGFNHRAERQVRRAAARARGLPGRFANLLWPDRARARPTSASARSSPGIAARAADRWSVAEQRAVYGAADLIEPTDASPVMPREWPAPGELATLRRRMDGALQQLNRGRHAPGIRQLRQAIGGLVRRDDWSHAADGAVALASALLRRGRPREAQTALGEARQYAGRAGRDAVLLDVAVLSGETWIDLARLDEAESVLGSALVAARGVGDAARAASASIALARCAYWRGQYGDAAATLAGAPSDALPSAAGRRDLLAARIAIGRGDVGYAMTTVSEALARARADQDTSAAAAAAYCAALVHLSVGDLDAVDRDVAESIAAARLAHDPLRAHRARLLQIEAERRRGRAAVAAALVKRLSRLTAAVPPIVRARCELLADLTGDGVGDTGAIVARHVAASRLGALALLVADARGPGDAGSFSASMVDEVVAIVRACQRAEEEIVVLKDVVSRLRHQLRAAAVGIVWRRGDRFDLCVSDGARMDAAIAERAIAAGVTIAPHRRDDRVEGAAAIQYGGAPIGALCARWSVGSTYDVSRAAAILEMAAVAAGPIVAAAMTRRDHDQTASSGVTDLLGITPAMRALRVSVERAAAAPFAVLVDGESGSGKELVARAVHRCGPRRDRPFCPLNCAALPDDLIEAELFGHARGAFTGAVADRPGVFEEAHGGTLFLDEIGELSPRAQAKVLRVIQEGELRRVGESHSRRVDARIIAATNRDLRRDMNDGRFRLDLLYRLDVIRISVPPLRERPEDIAVLAEHFWRDAAQRVGSRATLGAAALAALARHDWPGNVRELQNVLAALAVRSPKRGVVPPTALPPQFAGSGPVDAWRLTDARRTFDQRFVRAALVRAGGHRGRAAGELGVTRQGLTKLMTRLGIGE